MCLRVTHLIIKIVDVHRIYREVWKINYYSRLSRNIFSYFGIFSSGSLMVYKIVFI